MTVPRWYKTPKMKAAERARKRGEAQNRQGKKDPNFRKRTSKRPANNKGKGAEKLRPSLKANKNRGK